MRRSALFALVLLPGLAPAAEPAPELAALLKKAGPYRPAASNLAWRQIPWEIDPTAALKAAKDEQRPLLVWLAGGRKRDGSPLERC
ncbi:MAG: hypothetical protein K2X87_00640 [Gemmataceae bacterium]|nr:hypothetical protein [Gemmataceae bacterium]